MGCCLSTHDPRHSPSSCSDHKRTQPKSTESGALSLVSGKSSAKQSDQSLVRVNSGSQRMVQSTFGAQFEVFLSFRGPDTRDNFADSLYHALKDKGIRVFIDKKGIDLGEEIGLEIFQAIDDSKICIPIFSKGYASSSWCLRELEYMMERKKTNQLEVMPIFHDVRTADLKLETRLYRDALTLHKKKHGADTVKHWEKALEEVAKIKGWNTKETGYVNSFNSLFPFSPFLLHEYRL